jgi:hypothetical protein
LATGELTESELPCVGKVQDENSMSREKRAALCSVICGHV